MIHIFFTPGAAKETIRSHTFLNFHSQKFTSCLPKENELSQKRTPSSDNQTLLKKVWLFQFVKEAHIGQAMLTVLGNLFKKHSQNRFLHKNERPAEEYEQLKQTSIVFVPCSSRSAER